VPLRRDEFLRDYLRGIAISALLGLGISALMYFSAPAFFGPRIFGYGLLIGVLISSTCMLLEAALDPWIRKREPIVQKLSRAIVYFVGGNVGWFAATWIAAKLSMVHPQVWSFGQKMFIVNGVVAVVIGFLFYGYGVMRQRLEDNVAQLKEHEFAQKELELARSIQARLLPSPEIEGDGYRLAARNLPARFVAGDFYDAFHLDGGLFGIAVADVAGKGMGASLIMASAKASLPLIAAGRSAEATLRILSDRLAGELGPREFVALSYARYDPAVGTLELSNAGLPDPYLLREGCAPLALSVPGPRLPLGLRRGVAYESLRVTLLPGDRVLLLTDGLPEASTSPGEPLGYEALGRLLPADGHAPGQSLDELLERVRRATSESLEDDWTVLLLEHKGSSEPPRLENA
jgi:serine phosphatase RsbU (regulator of sigma subunit)